MSLKCEEGWNQRCLWKDTAYHPHIFHLKHLDPNILKYKNRAKQSDSSLLVSFFTKNILMTVTTMFSLKKSLERQSFKTTLPYFIQLIQHFKGIEHQISHFVFTKLSKIFSLIQHQVNTHQAVKKWARI